MLATQNSSFILGPIARVLGVILNWIFERVPNVGVSIILFTFFIYIVMLPLTYRQQKFSKLSARMNPELQRIREKYENRKDQESIQRMNEEMQLTYKKYGVSPSGSCVQLLIQMPILIALYRVIYSIPAYVSMVYECLEKLAVNILDTSDGISVIEGLSTTQSAFKNYISDGAFKGENAVTSIIDVLNRATSAEWDAISTIEGLDVSVFNQVREQFMEYYNFLGLNISDSPMYIIKESFTSQQWLLILGALMIPVLAAFTQWMNLLFTPKPAGKEGDSTTSMMNSMNITMPLMSAVFCFTLPCGLGLYWIAGAVIRGIEMVIINKHFDKMDMDAFIEKNIEKYNEELNNPKNARRAVTSSDSPEGRREFLSISRAAHLSTREMKSVEAASGAGEFEKDGIAYRAHLVGMAGSKDGNSN